MSRWDNGQVERLQQWVRDKLTQASLHGKTMDSPGMDNYIDVLVAQSMAQTAQEKARNHE